MTNKSDLTATKSLESVSADYAVTASRHLSWWKAGSGVLENEAILGYILMFPALALILTFIAYPFVLGVWMALTDKLVGKPGNFIGLQNFYNLFKSEIFWRTVWNTFIFTLSATVLKAVFGMWLAVLLNRKFRLSRFTRSAILLPFIVPTVLSGLAWLWMFDATFSVINWFLRWMWQVKLTLNSVFSTVGWVLFTLGVFLIVRYVYLIVVERSYKEKQSALQGGIMALLGLGMMLIAYLPINLVVKENWGYFKGPLWLGDPVLAMICIIAVNTWRGLPFFAVSFLAGLQTVPPELYDAGDIDGTSEWQKFWHITLPMIKPIAVVVVVFSLVVTFADFQVVYVLTRGGPSNSTHLFATLAYQLAMASGNLGEGAAAALFMFPFLALVILWQLLYLRKEGVN